ncbi:MAG: DMT family transporter, partial [Desulfobacterales bacterium]
MNTLMPLIIIAVIGGAAVTLQGQLMGLLDKALGTKESVFITYGGGGILAGFVMLAARGGNLKAWQSVPWYTLGAGALGLVIVGTIGYTVPRLGLTRAFTIIVAAQLIVAALLDHFGLLGASARPLDLGRLAGIGVL